VVVEKSPGFSRNGELSKKIVKNVMNCLQSSVLRGINRVVVKQLGLDSGLKLKGTYNWKLHSLVLIKQN